MLFFKIELKYSVLKISHFQPGSLGYLSLRSFTSSVLRPLCGVKNSFRHSTWYIVCHKFFLVYFSFLFHFASLNAISILADRLFSSNSCVCVAFLLLNMHVNTTKTFHFRVVALPCRCCRCCLGPVVTTK
jgi:hypothetical protein